MYKRLTSFFILLLCCFLFVVSCSEQSKDNKEEFKKSVKDSFVIKDPSQLYFVGNSGSYTGIYKYDFDKDSYDIFWSARNETVVKLVYSDDLQYIFFLTAGSLGIKNGISFINRIKLYRLVPELSSVEYITDIGNAIQIIAYWEEINFRVQFTSIDLRVATYINKTDQIYSPFGRLVQQTNDVFDFIRSGYPQFDLQTSSPVSPSGKYGFIPKGDSIVFKIIPDQKEFFVDTVKESVNKITWSRDENYAFVSTQPEETYNKVAGSVLIVYNTISHRLERKWESDGKINFLTTNNYLIFDLVDGNRTSVNIYNYKKFEDVREITLRKGCGLAAIP